MAAILYGIVTFLLQKVLLKFVMYTGIFLFVSEACGFLTTYITGGDGGIGAALNAISALGTFTVGTTTVDPVGGFWYLWNMFQVGNGLVLILTAYATRFLVRRIPLIG